ncbi:Histone-lysine N-methyltransferase SETMAR [Eumeta japonica]|uniref:Histone-lysine N-methyltransferase SETMAR n=1 Tax=Eumeta variegata TaxID=151549 RepID=A0A4C1U4E1_EUMVA|nr:Histone-lysine N-methyltransferase SETMAR [Eumeta japonica]
MPSHLRSQKNRKQANRREREAILLQMDRTTSRVRTHLIKYRTRWQYIANPVILMLDKPCSGRSVTDKLDVILEKLEQDRHISFYDIAEELGRDHKTVLTHLKKKAGYTEKLNAWVTYELIERNVMNRTLIFDSLLKRNETEPFSKRLIASDEKWNACDENVRKRSWSKGKQAPQTIAKPGLTRNQLFAPFFLFLFYPLFLSLYSSPSPLTMHTLIARLECQDILVRNVSSITTSAVIDATPLAAKLVIITNQVDA